MTENKDTIYPEQNRSVDSERDLMRKNLMDPESIARMEYSAWQERVPELFRYIVEGEMQGREVNIPDGYPLSTQYLKLIQEKMREGSGEGESRSGLDIDPRVAKIVKRLEKVPTAGGYMNLIKEFISYDRSWGLKAHDYKQIIDPQLRWLVEKDIEEQKKAQNKPVSSEESQERAEHDNEQGSDDEMTPPPTSEEAVSSMEHGMREMKEGEKIKPFFRVEPYYGGYYRQHIYDKLDTKSFRWQAQKPTGLATPKEGAEDIDIISTRTMTGSVRAGTPLPIPLPYGWTMDVTSLKVNGVDSSQVHLEKSNEDIWYLLVQSEGVFSYSVNIGRRQADELERNRTKVVLPEMRHHSDMEQLIAEMNNSDLRPLARARLITKKIHQHLEYSNDPDSFKRYLQDTSTALQKIWDEKKADCYVANTLAVATLLKAGVKARFVGGHMVRDKDEAGRALLHGSNGHAWCEVWDEIGERWVRLDATPAGDPGVDPEQQEKDLDGNDEGDYGESPEFVPPTTEDKKEQKKKKGAGEAKKKPELSGYDEQVAQFSQEAGCSKPEAQRFLQELERIRKIKNEQGEIISDMLVREWSQIVEERKKEKRVYTGPVRMSTGDRMTDPVRAYIDMRSGHPDPIGFERERPQVIKHYDFGGINIYFSFDLSGSMQMSDQVSGRSKIDVQRDISLLFIDSLMRCAIVTEQNSDREEVLPIKIMATVADNHGKVTLPLTDKWGAREQWALYTSLVKSNQGGTPTHETLALIRAAQDKEIKTLKEQNITERKMPLHYVVELSDGSPDSSTKAISEHQLLKKAGVVVRNFVVGDDPYDDTGVRVDSFSAIPNVLSRDIVEEFKKLKSHAIKRT